MSTKLTLRPLGVAGPAEAGGDSPCLAGGPLVYAAVEAVLRDAGRVLERRVLAPGAVHSWALEKGQEAEAERLLARLTAARPPFAGLPLDRPRIMAVINVTPDSFSDGGDRFDAARAVADGLALREAGAEILDVGGESTRPGAAPVSEEEELRRVLPVVRGLAEAGALISIDTRHARVMQEALSAGARIINDVTALAGDPRSLAVAAEAAVPVVLMHMRGEPRTMQTDPHYQDAALDIYDFLESRIEACEAAGLARDKIAVDPGIGFGKTVAHNLRILEQMALYQGLGTAVVLGASRKSFIGRLSRRESAKDRTPASLAAALAGAARGVQILRVHDVAETRQALTLWQAIALAPPAGDPDVGSTGQQAGRP